jgi:hypothetical protein
LEGAG